MTGHGSGVSPSVWDRAAGQPAAVRALRAALHDDEVAHAWLLTGPEGAGQEPLGRALAAALNCPVAATPDEPCGACSTCDRIARGVHPATIDLVPEGATYLVDAVRDGWIREATRSLTEGRRKVLRVTAADRMTEPTQNAFLKILEEPPPSVVWLLEAEDESALLETVVSRCRRLTIVPWGPDALQLEAIRLGVPAAERDALVRAAMGSPRRLADLADPEVAAARRRHLAVVDRLATAGPGAVVPLAKELVSWAKGRAGARKVQHEAELVELQEAFGVDDRGRGWPPGMKARIEKRHARLEREEQRRALDLLLDDLATYLRDLLAVRSGGPGATLVNTDHASAIERDAARLPSEAAVTALGAIVTCRDALDQNGNPELQLERLLLSLALPLYAAAA